MRHIMPYPSPQVPATAGPFFGQTVHDAAPVAGDLPSLQPHDDSQRSGSPSMGAPAVPADGEPQFVTHAPAMDESLQQVTPTNRLAMAVDDLQQHQSAQPTSPEQRNTRSGRPKNTKACDECRRKKIRCDMTMEDPDTPCTACRRTGSACQSSRQQMKRGPSKGYIKELAARLNSLESQFGPQGHLPFAGVPFPTPNGAEVAVMEQSDQQTDPTVLMRKRTFSDMHGSTSIQTNQLMPGRPELGQQDFNVQSGSPRRAATPNFQASSSIGSIWRFGSQDGSRREAVGIPYGSDAHEQENEGLQDWNEDVVDEYYRLIHQTFPLLPHSRLRLRSRLVRCPPTLREAFLTALDTAIRGSPTSHLSSLETSNGARKAAALIAASQFESTSSRTMSANLIYIQTLILMALESDHHGPATMRGQIGPPRAEWLGRAVGMAMHLKLNNLHPKDRFGEGDPDADEKLGRRVWWILFILDRWHASSTAQLLQLPENSTSLLLEDQILLGESTYHLARLSYILGHLSAILQQPPSLMSRESAAAPIITTTVLGELDRFRESVENVLLGAPNLVHLTYWHVRLMVLRLSSSTSAEELLVPATRMASILNSSYTMITPLNHHFAALAAMTLVELSDFEETKERAMKGVADMVEAIGTKRGLQSREDSTGWDGAIRELVVKRQGQLDSRAGEGSLAGNLRHLADAAIGGSGERAAASRPVPSSFDPTTMTRSGYLAALVQENRM